MPSVEMRRTTRVFGARVLRSGRRVWTGPGEGKHKKAAEGEEWMGLLDSSGNGGGDAIQDKENGWHDDSGLKHEITEIDTSEKKGEPEGKIRPNGLLDDNSVDRMWGVVYQRKRKRVDSENVKFSGNSGKMRASDRMYGKQFFRKQYKKRITETPVPGIHNLKPGFVGRLYVSQGSLKCRVLTAVVESSCSSSSLFACFLNSVLRHMTRVRVRLPQLSAFVFSEPICHVYSSQGIHFLQDSIPVKSSGICKFVGSSCFIPLFTVDYSAVPFCFMHLHSSLLLRSASLPYVLVMCSKGIEVKDDGITDDKEQLSCIPCEVDKPGSKIVASENGISGKRRILQPTVAAPKLTGRTLQLRNGVSSRSIQKRRSSLRSRRSRNSSASGMRKANGAFATDLLFSHERMPTSPVVSNHELSRSVRRSSTTNIKELKSLVVGLTMDIDSTSCSANILVIGSDKCYREEGAIISLDISASKQWVIAVNRDGIRRYSLTAQKVMRACSCNRFTHAMVWTSDDNSWKLEFPNRQDWLIFKELYRECSDRNVRPPTVNIIPVPGVHEVSGYADSNCIPFRRPDSYITWIDDELARALAKKTGNYDLDIDDEEWLNKFNDEYCADNEFGKHVSPDTFELIIDAFEKGFYCSPDDYSDVKTAADLCSELEKKEVLEAVHCYWMKKRKQKRSALVRVFQCYQPRRAQLLPKAVMRKKRSFKRQASQAGRGKQPNLLKAMAAEQDAVEDENTILKVQEAKASANRSEGMAVVKRQRAQLLMENADLAAYKATMAVRIAEAAGVAQSLEDAAASFLLG